ncbi:MAG TPA: hypothetical protein VJ596_07975, partial [Gemmatimonadaceae bacterium]|nr:hypothetical protein [Gemmatimonadaceae bacterium]
PFLRLNVPSENGRVGGKVVFARDLGAHNELLRPRFGERSWYRYVPRRGPGDSSPVFERYDQSDAPVAAAAANANP